MWIDAQKTAVACGAGVASLVSLDGADRCKLVQALPQFGPDWVVTAVDAESGPMHLLEREGDGTPGEDGFVAEDHRYAFLFWREAGQICLAAITGDRLHELGRYRDLDAAIGRMARVLASEVLTRTAA